MVVLRGDKENIAPSYLIDEFSRTKIFVVGENVKPYFSESEKNESVSAGLGALVPYGSALSPTYLG